MLTYVFRIFFGKDVCFRTHERWSTSISKSSGRESLSLRALLDCCQESTKRYQGDRRSQRASWPQLAKARSWQAGVSWMAWFLATAVDLAVAVQVPLSIWSSFHSMVLAQYYWTWPLARRGLEERIQLLRFRIDSTHFEDLLIADLRCLV